MYHCEAATIEGFIQQLAVCYVGNGYWFYVTGCIPLEKNPIAVDRKLSERYDLDVSKWTRHRRKKKGVARIQYLRFRFFFVLLATAGKHHFARSETTVKDIRREPIQCFGYSIGCYRGSDQRWHPSVRIDRAFFRELKEQFKAKATMETAEDLATQLRRLPFEPYAPVRRQTFRILWVINKVRKRAGLELLPKEVLIRRRRPVLPFAEL